MTSPWTAERVSDLERLWTDGLSASEIAQRLGGVTRNAVLGKLHRLGRLGGRHGLVVQRPVAAIAERRPRNRREPAAPRIPRTGTAAHAPAGDNAPMGPFLPLIMLGAHLCRWPIGDPHAGAFGFCGRLAPTGPYCGQHAAVAYVASGRRTARGREAGAGAAAGTRRPEPSRPGQGGCAP